MSLLDIEQAIINFEQGAFVVDAMLQLERRLLDIVLLLYDGLSKEQICERLSITSACYDKRMVKIRSRLAEKLKAYNDG